jgi:aspartyl protease family protein
MLAWIVLLIAALGGLFVALQTGFSVPSFFPIGLAAAGCLASIYVLSSPTRDDAGGPAGRVVIWFLALAGALGGALPLLALMLSSTERAPLSSPVTGQVLPSVEAQGPTAVRIRQSPAGRFETQAIVNGRSVPAIVDTGATAVMLRSSDAAGAGIDVDGLAFDTPLQTANGTTYAAPVRIRSIRVGVIEITDVEGFVAKPGSLNESLLGISFLRRLASYDIAGGFLTLRN